MAQTTTTGTIIAANPSTMKILSQTSNSMTTTTAINSPTIAKTAPSSATTNATNSPIIATTVPSSTIETIETVQSITTTALSTTSDIEGNVYLNFIILHIINSSC